MRIIGGRLAGLRLTPPKNLPVRPTTDIAKEALFNLLSNRMSFEGISVLDLFSGTGNIAIEFASRGAYVDAVDVNTACYKHLQSCVEKYALDTLHPIKADALKYLKSVDKKYDFIFADPPYDLPCVPELHRLVFEGEKLVYDSTLVVENPSLKKFDNLRGFTEQRCYSQVGFNFFIYS